MSSPPLSPHSPAPTSSPPSSSLRLATFNIGLGCTRKLPRVLARCIDLSLDIIALQEIGDPALRRSTHGQYFLVASPGPSAHEAGVGLLISRDLAPRCRTFKRSSSGRLVGVVLELSKGHQLLIVSAYMPTGLDHRASSDDAIKIAHGLYSELLGWTRGMQQVVCMGDLNETLTVHDRYPKPAVARPHAGSPSPMQCLVDAGYTDAYRHLHPNAARDPGFTHLIHSLVRPSRSRIDYIWTHGAPVASLLRSGIDTRLHNQGVSHHRLLWLELELLHAPSPPCKRDLAHVRIPDLRASPESASHRDAFIQELDRNITTNDHHLSTLANTLDAASLSDLATELTHLTHRSAFAHFPITGSKPYRSKSVLDLERQRRNLTRLLRMAELLHACGHRLTLSPEWVRLHAHCLRQHQLHWVIDAYYSGDDAGWIAETRRILNSIRLSITREKRSLRVERVPSVDVNRAAAIHRMLDSDALPSQLYSVIDAHGELTTNASELEDVMVRHFESVFALPPPDPAPLMPPPPAMLFEKAGVEPAWYDGLMDPVTEPELLELVRGLPLVSAPGQDEVSTGVWKLAIQNSEPVRRHVIALFSACMRTSTFPSAWKTSVIIPFVKDAQKERAMNNIRPISLQSCLGKLLNRLLAHRLGAILQRHPILNAAQRGFILGGTTMKCIDELLDAWDWSRSEMRELYTIFYDIKQAYDSVQVQVLVRAMHRLRLPVAFIKLVTDSLTDLSSCVRTVYGLTRRFAVCRSIRQGDPLAPLLFILLMDALHDGLDLNPFTNSRHGCRLAFGRGGDVVVEIASQGYADDTAVLTNSLADLRVQNDWVQYFMRFNSLRLNPLKCELVGRGADGLAVTFADLALHDIAIDGVALVPVPHNRSIRYLGVHATFDGSWVVQQNKTRSAILTFTRVATKFHLTLSDTIYMFNVFLAPRIELALHYVHGPGTSTWIRGCDALLIGCIKHLASSHLSLSHSALALTLHLLLPSWLEIGIKVCELFLRMNSSDARWGVLGRCIMRAELPSTVDATTRLARPNAGTRLTRAAYLAVKRLGWSLHLRQLSRRSDGRHQHLFDVEPHDSLLSLSRSDCALSPEVELTEGKTCLVHDVWCGWSPGGRPLREEIHVYTDGSFDPPTSSSAWSVVVGDRWFDDNFGSVPADEADLAQQPAHINGATLIGSSIACTRGVYPAELQAIARTLAMFPLSARLHIHSDSRASIDAIKSFVVQQNERRRLRMSARTILQLISHLWSRRLAAGGGVQLTHVPAHTTDTDAHSVGNRMADYQANVARVKSDRTFPLGLKQLPLATCEYHLHVKSTDPAGGGGGGLVIIDDLRRTGLALLKSTALAKWVDKHSSIQSYFAGDGVMDLGRDVLRAKSSSQQQHTLVHVATNSIHFVLMVDDDDASKSLLGQLHCTACDSDLTLAHLASCPEVPCVKLRHELHTDIIGLFAAAHDECHRWLRAMSHLDLGQLLLSLFPPSRSASPVKVGHHTARCLIGAFTRAECTAAVRSLGIVDREDGRRTFCALRLLCLDHIGAFYAKLKVRV